METATKRNGFTLIELLVCIAIVAIISTVGMVMYSQAQKNARDGKRIGDLEEIQKALEQYYAITRAYPDNTTTIYPTVINSYFANGLTPKDPSTNSQYNYYPCSGNTGKYNICATLESCGSKCNVSAAPTGCLAAPLPVTGNTILCKSNISN